MRLLRLAVMATIALCLSFGVWALWQFPGYAREMPPWVLPNGRWTTPAAQAAVASLGWATETYVGWRLGFVLVTAVFYVALGLFVLWRRRDDPFALLFALTLVLFGIGAMDLPFVLAQFGRWGDRMAYGLAGLAYGLLNFLVFVFPDGRFVPRQMRWVGGAAVLFILYAAFLQPQPTRPPAPWVVIVSSALLLMGVLGQVYRYRVVATAVERQQTKWVLWAICLNLAYKLLLNVIYMTPAVNALNGQGMWYSLLRTTILTLVTATIPIAVTLAILRYRLWDIDVLIRKTVVYSVMIVAVVGLYVLLVGYLGSLFHTDGGNLTLSLAATGVVAVLFTPFQNYVQRQVNRLFYGQRDEPYTVLTRLGQQLQAAIEPAAALQLTVTTIAQSLKLPYVAIALQQGESWPVTAVYGASGNTINRFPLVYAGQTIGELQAASRTLHDPLTPADTRLLTDLARQIGVVGHAALLAANLEQARLRLVTERGEARRQLGSDLHDSVGHQLVALVRQLEHVTTGAPHESALADIHRQLLALTQQVRALAHQLFPPELALLGLAGALRERIHTQTRLQIYLDAPEDLPALPAEIETAVYYIALEALTNVEKHAQAQMCYVRLRLVDGLPSARPTVLELDVQDDGRGWPMLPTTSGMGQLSMQARAAEVGGVCMIGEREGGGTAVAVRIPYPSP